MPIAGRRRRYVIDPLQRKLLWVNAAYYWTLALLIAGFLYVPRLAALRSADLGIRRRAAGEIALLHGFFWPAAALVFVLFTLHVALVSHRVVGPLVRLRRGLAAIAEGDLAARVALREGDYLHLEAAAFNDMAAALEARWGASAPPAPAATGCEAAAVERTFLALEAGAPRVAREARQEVREEDLVGAGLPRP